MTKYQKTRLQQEPPKTYNSLQESLIGIACIGFFPVLYWIGKTLTAWLG